MEKKEPKNKTIWMNPPLKRLHKELGEAKGREGKFSRRLGDIVERYGVIMSLTRVPDMTNTEKMILGEVVCGSVLSPTTIKYMDESVIDAATGTDTEPAALSKKIASWSPAERIAAIESLRV